METSAPSAGPDSDEQHPPDLNTLHTSVSSEVAHSAGSDLEVPVTHAAEEQNRTQ